MWEIGLELENELERGKIEGAIKKLMVDVEGEEIRNKATDLKEKTELCLREGGSSCRSLNGLMNLVWESRSTINERRNSQINPKK